MRADAVRNSERILRAAREVFAASGPEASLEEIARRAGVGSATVYRRFTDKEELVRAALDQSLTEIMSPAAEQALSDENPRRALATMLEAAMSIAARERSTLAAAKNSGAIAAEVPAQFFATLAQLLRRGQRAGQIRDDVVPDDLHRIMGMLVGVLWSMDPDSDGWKRYVTLILDALSPTSASPLQPPAPLSSAGKPDHWPVPSDE
ncbi:TetR/AcrR family transcriptional regulator [Streptomyces sp. NPDC059922]|uniref:TetR/AcrR family transcriptional regulator n=1 Tax=Streptomyces sp. NPDC059922 TaxID=3347005 RepID=UPI00364AAA60